MHYITRWRLTPARWRNPNSITPIPGLWFMVSQIKIVSGLTGTAVGCARSEIFSKYRCPALPRGSHALIDAVIESSGFNFISRFSILIYQSVYIHAIRVSFRFKHFVFLSRYISLSTMMQLWRDYTSLQEREFLLPHRIREKTEGKLIHAHSPQLTSTIFLEHTYFSYTNRFSIFDPRNASTRTCSLYHRI